jgi:hypothetical protein
MPIVIVLSFMGVLFTLSSAALLAGQITPVVLPAPSFAQVAFADTPVRPETTDRWTTGPRKSCINSCIHRGKAALALGEELLLCYHRTVTPSPCLVRVRPETL